VKDSLKVMLLIEVTVHLRFKTIFIIIVIDLHFAFKTGPFALHELRLLII